ncbi:HK97 family phage prohead protease [Micromonospora chalcea]|uniref:HK97 family phage prohead protease n=1 Tax=Micromonospora chalcea TaxID=1874 RepID=UPI002883026A|nr:HK97 family phage prohead protease [Micromonospora chalcea]
MLIKTAPARIRAAGKADGLGEGEFEAIVSVFGNVDSYGDVVMPGAFTDVLDEWKAKGDPIPVIWSHNWYDPFAHIGTVLEAKETDVGLWVKGLVDQDPEARTAAQVYRLLKGRRVTQFSFAYDIADASWAERDGQDVYELRKFGALYEVGPCLVGANQETELLAAKARQLANGVKEGRVLAQAHLDRLKSAHTALGEVIAAAETSDPKAGSGTAKRTAGQPADPTNDNPAAPGKSSAASDRSRSAQAAARLQLLTLTGETQ